MSPVFHLLWLLLLLCSLLLLVGCRATMVGTPVMLAPTASPPTLTTVFFPLLDVPTPFRLSRPAIASTLGIRRTWASPPLIPIEPPTCYEQPTKRIVCLGRLNNTSNLALQDVQVSVQLGRHQQVVTIEQHTIYPQTFAPYRAQFANIAPTSPVSAKIVKARSIEQVASELILADETGRYQPTTNGYGHYDFSAVVINPTAKNILHPRLIVTVLNQENAVVGYRVVEIADEIRSYQQVVIQTQIIPQSVSDTLYHYAQLENDDTLLP
jgi:hypothetical protein